MVQILSWVGRGLGAAIFGPTGTEQSRPFPEISVEISVREAHIFPKVAAR
jgi:hypothetical protein